MFRYFFAYDKDIPAGTGVANFTATHFIWLAATAVVIAVLLLLYRRMNHEARQRFTATATIAILVLEVIRQGWLLIIGRYDITRHLPLHLCGIMIFVEAFAVFGKKPAMKEFAYACGLPGAAMALLTPEPSNYPFWNIQYLESIFVHALLALVPLLWILDGFRPNIRALPKNMAILAGLAAFCFGLNLLLGGNSNYMFVHFAPAGTPIEIFDKWVGWPWYIGPLLGFALVLWGILYAPWALAAWAKKRRQAGAGAAAAG